MSPELGQPLHRPVVGYARPHQKLSANVARLICRLSPILRDPAGFLTLWTGPECATHAFAQPLSLGQARQLALASTKLSPVRRPIGFRWQDVTLSN